MFRPLLKRSPPDNNVDIIPGALNIVITISAATGALVLLRIASLSNSPFVIALSVLAFSFLGNTLFSCLHESVHGLFHPNKRINDFFGIVCAAFFPTGYSLQRTAHLGHHKRNRTHVEMFDYYTATDNRFLKIIQWYGIISGIYWIVAVSGCFLYLVFPFAFRASSRKNQWSDMAERTSGPAYLRSFSAAPPLRARLEILFTIVFQLLMFYLLDLTVTGWVLCYLAFGLQWSALQYADHAFAPLDVIEGAWDLRVHPIIQTLFLNYHLHLAHHRHPSTSWIYLPAYIDTSRDRPHFLRQYLRMWLGPQPMPTSSRPGDPVQ